MAPDAGNRDAALEAVGVRALLAEAARREDLDDDPTVSARLAASRREILAAAYLEKALADAVREDVLRRRYDAIRDQLARRRIHVAHVVARPVNGDPSARAVAHAVVGRAYERVSRGEAFDSVARELSQDPVTAARGGDLGPLLEGQVDAAFFEAAAALRPGEVSKPIESPYGVHLLKALAAVEIIVPTFEEARGRLAAEARAEAEHALIERLRGDIGLELHPERLTRRSSADAKAAGGEGR
jgi:parvulin-like peptidyl-prolyl isomerase